jgi:hypothetical protein
MELIPRRNRFLLYEHFYVLHLQRERGHTLIKKKKETFLINKEIQKESGATSYMRIGFHEEMRKYLVIYEEAVSHTVYDFAPYPF